MTLHHEHWLAPVKKKTLDFESDVFSEITL